VRIYNPSIWHIQAPLKKGAKMLSIRRVSQYFIAFGVISTVAADTLSTNGFTECGNGPQDVSVSQFQINFDRTTKEIVFAVAGTSKLSQNITGKVPVVLDY
jgi:hypothetical protein